MENTFVPMYQAICVTSPNFLAIALRNYQQTCRQRLQNPNSVDCTEQQKNRFGMILRL